MSEATEAQLEMEELEELQQKMAKEEQTQASAESAKPEPQPTAPAPEPTPVAPTVPDAPQTPEPVAQSQSGDSPMDWAKKKGLDSPEKIARSLQQMEQEFHRRNQKGHPGYQDLPNGNPAPMPHVPPQWSPQPQVPYQPAPQFAPPPYGYPPPYAPSRENITAQLAKTYNMDPQDVERLMPLVVDAAEAIAARRTASVEQRMAEIQRNSSRNDELFQLMQDPAFSDPNVQMEMHEALKDGSLFQRERAPYVAAFKTALENLGRKQLLQQGGIPNGNPSTGAKPPVTAGGGNGSSQISSTRGPSPEEFEKWTFEQQEAFIMEGKLPKRR